MRKNIFERSELEESQQLRVELEMDKGNKLKVRLLQDSINSHILDVVVNMKAAKARVRDKEP